MKFLQFEDGFFVSCTGVHCCVLFAIVYVPGKTCNINYFNLVVQLLKMIYHYYICFSLEVLI